MLIESVNERETRTESTTGLPLEEELVNRLKARRLELAREENVPAYVIFSDATLHELATYLPQAMDDLPRISGFGEVKIGKYGAQFLEVIQQYCEEHALDSRMEKARRTRRHQTQQAQRVSDTKQASFELFQEGKSVEEIAQIRGFVPSTIYGHLLPYLADGKVEISEFMPEARANAIREAVKVHGESSLKTLKTALDEDIDYGEIKVVLTDMRRGRENLVSK